MAAVGCCLPESDLEGETEPWLYQTATLKGRTRTLRMNVASRNRSKLRIEDWPKMMTSSQIALARLNMRSVQRGSNRTRNDLRCRKRWGQHEHQPCLSQWSRVVLYTELIVGMFTPFPLSNVCIRLYVASYFNVIISFIIINDILIILIVTKGSNDYIVIIAFNYTHILISAPLEFWSHSSYDWRFGSHP